jgi:hypothetical protein
MHGIPTFRDGTPNMRRVRPEGSLEEVHKLHNLEDLEAQCLWIKKDAPCLVSQHRHIEELNYLENPCLRRTSVNT